MILLDTFGELAATWGLADVAFVGGSLDGKRGGQNMIEPAAYGAAVLFGPWTWNFKDTVARLLEAGAALQVPDAAALEHQTLRLLADPQERAALGLPPATLRHFSKVLPNEHSPPYAPHNALAGVITRVGVTYR